MPPRRKNHFSGPVSVFLERRLPEKAKPAGYAALIDAYRLEVPPPRTLCAIGLRHKIVADADWRIFTPRHEPDATLEGHATFALKYEGVDLAVLKRLFLATSRGDIEDLVRAKPTGSYARRIWFLFEWLTGQQLGLPAAAHGSYVPVLDPDWQWAMPGDNSPRHRVRNNLPGTPDFCPLAFRTDALNRFVAMNLAERARAIVAKIPADVVARAAAFLLLEDSRSSYVIEGERPPHDRIERWGRAIGEAGRRPLELVELLRLQRVVIGDPRFVRMGLRQSGGFVGEHDRKTHVPIPVHIGARPEDLRSLIAGMISFDRGGAGRLDPVIAAAMLAFGFVYAHPFEDGNGRIHRYLIHHVLAHRGFHPVGVVFPVSAAIRDKMVDYRAALESYSRRLLPLIEWRSTERSNVKVSNDTADFYRYFDATPHAEFLYACVEKTIEEVLPNEADFLQRYDRFRAGIARLVDMPDRKLDLLLRFLRQNDGRLSKRARDAEFAALAEQEVQTIERIYEDAFARAAAGR